jgi:cytochrome c551/c552
MSYYTMNEIPTGDLAKVPLRAIPPISIPTKETKNTPKKEKVGATKDIIVNSKEVAVLLKKHACLACHAEASKVVGPAYTEIAKRNYTNEQILELVYKPKPENWPDYATEMAPMSHVPKADVLKIAAWINTLGKKGKTDLNKIDNHD